MRVDFLATTTHFIDHLAPIFKEFPLSMRGIFFTTRALRDYGTKKGMHVRTYGKEGFLLKVLRERNSVIVVAGYNDLCLSSFAGRPQVFLEHGVGFRFTGDFPYYPGSTVSREHVVLFLSPSQRSANIQKEACPWSEAVAIGCPKMDEWHKLMELGWNKKKANPPTVAVSFHFDSGPVQEMRSALPFYRNILSELSSHFNVIGHGHPRWASSLAQVFDQIGIPFEYSFERILEQADVYVCDASSTIYEFASTNRPVVLLNAPWYRKTPLHEGHARFWEQANVGLQCDSPNDLIETIYSALEDSPETRYKRNKAIQEVYKATDGGASQRAIDAIQQIDLKKSLISLTERKKKSIPRVRPVDIVTEAMLSKSWNSKFGIVITNRNRTENLEHCLQSIAAQSINPKWVAIANLGSDTWSSCSMAWTARRFGVSYLDIDYHGPWNKGLAFNTAVRNMPEAEYIIQLDVDMILAPDLLLHTCSVLETHEAVTYFPRFVSKNAVHPRYEGSWHNFNELVRQSRSARNMWAVGGYVALPYSWLVENKGIDESFVGWGFEDTDLWWRATTTLSGHVEANGARLIHRSHEIQADKKTFLSKNKNRSYGRFLGDKISINPNGWGNAPVKTSIIREGIISDKKNTAATEKYA
ncbi:CDP-glycerol glycerophosphotransferase family protein [Flagellimonas sp. S3867]|uniref:CDP-glycerol glycerophosphotransferase family protein n=1 Tax=Flagellimonas sp. S3867 TaxID=2768063 RepID=UPI001685CA73|nr:CDP-glycerol glycerophosphotransferase family protein [Flagellimonas sp. S3867]